MKIQIGTTAATFTPDILDEIAKRSFQYREGLISPGEFFDCMAFIANKIYDPSITVISAEGDPRERETFLTVPSDNAI